MGNVRGKTVGQAVIKSFVHDYIHGKGPGYKPLYTQAQFDRMVSDIRSEYEHGVYLRYVAIYNGMVEELIRAQGFFQQAQNGFLQVRESLSNVLRHISQRNILWHLSDIVSVPPEHINQVAMLLELMDESCAGIDTLNRDRRLWDSVAGARENLLLPAMRGLMAYNVLLEILADVLSLAQVVQLQMDLTTLQTQLEDYNAEVRDVLGKPLLPCPPVMRLHPPREDIATAQETLTARQHALIGELFPPLSLAVAAPPETRIQEAREALGDPARHDNGIVQQTLINLLGGEVQ